MTEAAVSEALGNLAGLLVETGAKVGLNEVRAVLRELERAAYSVGYADGETAMGERACEAETAREYGD